MSSSDGKPSTSRALSNWTMSYNQYTSETESPSQFHLWVGLSVLASAVRKNIWIDQGIYLLYPNMFVVLVGPPGKVGKSTSLRMGRNILEGVDDIQWSADSLTREELIRAMAKAGLNRSQSALTAFSTELSSLIEPSGTKMIQFLTDIYDSDTKWKYSTKHSGRDFIENPVLNILGATTPSWIAEGLPVNVLDHGFTARVVFVYGDAPNTLQPFPSTPANNLVQDLISDLEHISLLEGPMAWGQGSKKMYSEMYHDLASTIPDDYRVEGFHNRKKIHILKVAMLLSISESDDMVLRMQDLSVAWEMIKDVEVDMGKTFSAVGKNENATNTERIIARIYKDVSLTSTQIHQEFFAMGGIEDIHNMLQMARMMGQVTRKDVDGETIYYPVT